MTFRLPVRRKGSTLPSQSSLGPVAGGEVGEARVYMRQRGRGGCCEVGGRGVGAGTGGRGQQSEQEKGESPTPSLASGRRAWKRAWQGGVCAPGSPASPQPPSAGKLPGSPSTARLRARMEAAASSPRRPEWSQTPENHSGACALLSSPERIRVDGREALPPCVRPTGAPRPLPLG